MAEHEVAITLIEVVIPIIITVAGLGGFWILFKSRLTSVRNFIVGLDDALKDDKLTSAELKLLAELIKKIIEKDPETAKALLNKKE